MKEKKKDVLIDLYKKLTADEMLKIAHQPQNFIVLCQQAYFDVPICKNYMSTGGTAVFSPIRGVCYSMNLQPPSGQELSQNLEFGSLVGLKIILDIECKGC